MSVTSRSLGRSGKIEWKGPDRFQEDGVLIYPPDFQQDKEYPLVLIIHGGPSSASTTQFDFLGQLRKRSSPGGASLLSLGLEVTC